MILTEEVYLQMCKDLEHAGYGSYGRVFADLTKEFFLTVKDQTFLEERLDNTEKI